MLFTFRLGRIPVQVHGSHLLIAVVFGFQFASGPQTPWSMPLTTALWVGIIFGSVLIHELGHALASLAFGYAPVITLAGLGGNTRPNAPGPIAWWRDVLLTVAGPFAGLMLALGAAGGALLVPDRHSAAGYVLLNVCQVNLLWTVMNLCPVTPLDGGRISSAVLIRIFGKRGQLLSQVVTLLVGGGIAAWGATQGWMFLALIFGWYAFNAIAGISASLRSPSAGQVLAQDPHAPLLGAASTAYREGRLADAQKKAEGALAQGVSPAVRSALHQLLGWVALKEGHGQQALDHFAQVEGRQVEPYALAAGFSLAGDDARALSLWEHAFRETQDPTVQHEWAGALLRLGRAEDAWRISGVDKAGAYACAERVLFLRGEFERAAAMGQAGLEVAPTAERAYDTACDWARAGNPDAALALLQRAAALGFSDAAHAADDDDLASLKGHPGFQAWLDGLRHAKS